MDIHAFQAATSSEEEEEEDEDADEKEPQTPQVRCISVWGRRSVRCMPCMSADAALRMPLM